MVCEHCGAVAREGTLVCDQCGAMLPVREMGKGAAAIRQGRNTGKAQKGHGGSRLPDTRDNVGLVLDEEKEMTRRLQPAKADTQPMPLEKAKKRHGKSAVKVHNPHKLLVNWAMIGAVALVLVVLSVVGGFVFLNMTPEGQLVMARFGYESDAEARWKLGREYLDQGYIEKSIATYEQAYEQDPEIEGIYGYLEQLCEAYEAGARPEDAERIYTLMYQTIDEANPVAYRNIVRLMLDQNRNTEAAEFLRLAYEKTNDVSFKTQREEMLPSSPTTSLSAGRYLLPRDITLESAEEYDIYYIIGDEGTLPEDGTRFEEPIHLEEGGWTLRAVAVSTELCSDELNVKYVITLPTPDAPKASLASGAYERQQRVWLRNVGDDPDVTYYYTIDSSVPTINSPIYTGDPIYLPGGRVTVRAVGVNKYGKVSNEMSVQYQIGIPFKKYYRETDSFNEFTVMKTTYDQFIKKFGSPTKEEETTDKAIRGKCRVLTYSWGEARFYYAEKGSILYSVDTTSANVNAPRSTKLGLSEAQITDKYRDMGQFKNQDGSRSLYYDSIENCYGMVYKDSETEKRIVYSYFDATNEATVTLTYYLENDKCVRLVNSTVIS